MPPFSYLNLKLIPDADASGGGAGGDAAVVPDVTREGEVPGTATEVEESEESAEETPEAETPKPKKPAKPKTVTVSRDELERLRAAEKKTKDAESQRKRASDEAVRSKEDEAAAKDGLKAVEMVRKRLARDIGVAQDRIAELESENTNLRERLTGRVMRDGIAAAVDRVVGKLDATLRPGAMKHLTRDVAGRLEATAIDESTDEYLITDRETGESVDDVLAEMFKSEEYALFLDRKAEAPAPGVRGTNARGAAGGKPAKAPDVVESYHNRVREHERQNGVQPSIGLRPKS